MKIAVIGRGQISEALGAVAGLDGRLTVDACNVYVEPFFYRYAQPGEL